MTESEHRRSRARAHFFPVYHELDQKHPISGGAITLEQRNRAAAYAAAAAAVGVDAIVTAAPTVGRSDVADNDTVVSVTPDDAVALIGHHLRMTNNPVVQVRSGRLVGGGTWTETESAATIKNLYDWGIGAGMPYFDSLQMFIAPHLGGPPVARLD